MTAVDFLGQLLVRGAIRIGQVRINPDFSLHHFEDAGSDNLAIYPDPHDAIEIAKHDDAKVYRPLKTAPNLRHGWILRLADLRAVHLALDFLYPAALGTLVASKSNCLAATPLRTTLARQTGMYAVTKKITDAQAETVINRLCRPGCLRKILWPIASGDPVKESGVPAIEEENLPLLCAEACNLFVAECRKEVKADQSSSGSM